MVWVGGRVGGDTFSNAFRWRGHLNSLSDRLNGERWMNKFNSEIMIEHEIVTVLSTVERRSSKFTTVLRWCQRLSHLLSVFGKDLHPVIVEIGHVDIAVFCRIHCSTVW